MIEIIELRQSSRAHRAAAASILVTAFAHAPSAWKTEQEARDEIHQFDTDPDRIAYIALDDGSVVGWIGAIIQSPYAWEMHPLAVLPARQRKGVGLRLVSHLEAAARAAGVVTIWLGTDDDFGGTNLFGRDLFPNVLDALAALAPTDGHPYTFYLRAGYSVTGVFPDVDGIGRHDILMAKRIVSADNATAAE